MNDPLAVDIDLAGDPPASELATVSDDGATVTMHMDGLVIRCDRAELLERLGIAAAIATVTQRNRQAAA